MSNVHHEDCALSSHADGSSFFVENLVYFSRLFSRLQIMEQSLSSEIQHVLTQFKRTWAPYFLGNIELTRKEYSNCGRCKVNRDTATKYAPSKSTSPTGFGSTIILAFDPIVRKPRPSQKTVLEGKMANVQFAMAGAPILIKMFVNIVNVPVTQVVNVALLEKTLKVNAVYLYQTTQKKRPNWKEVFKIIEKDDANKLRQQVKHEMLELVALPQESKDHKPAFHAALESTASECLEVWLEARSGLGVLDSPDNDGNTPLHAAVEGLNCDVITKLIKAGANVNLHNKQGHSPLHLLLYVAVEAKNFDTRAFADCLEVLLDACRGLDVLDSPDNDGNTPLHAAVKGLNCDPIIKLINAGANVNLRNDKGNSPLHLLAYAAATAASGGESDSAEASAASGGESSSAEATAASGGESSSAEATAASGGESSSAEATAASGGESSSAEATAASGGESDSAEATAASGGESDSAEATAVSGRESSSAEATAASGGESSSAEATAASGGESSSAEATAASGGEATAAAFIENFDKCVDALLECPSLDLDALNYSKFTPLRAAAEQMPSKTGSLKTFCQKLVQKGANIDEHTRSILVEHSLPNSPDEATTLPQPQTATAELLNLLICNQSEGIADMFSGVCGSQEVRAAANCYLGSKKVICYLVDRCSETGVMALLQAGADPWSSNRNGELALHRALARGHVAIVNLLINEMKEKKNSNRIDLRHKSFTLLQKLLKNNKDADKTATKSYDPNKYECLNRLFEDDVLIDVNQKEEGTDMKQTALHIACKMNNQDAMAILLEHGAYLGEHQMIGEQDNGTVLNALMAKTLEKTMDNCIKVPSQTIEKNDTLDPERKDRILEEDALDLNYILELNYQFLMSPTPREPTKVQQLENEVSLLYDISQSHELRNSIKHPLIQTLIYAKWGKIAFTSKSYIRCIENYLEWFLIIALLVFCFAPLSASAAQHLKAWVCIAFWYNWLLMLGRLPPYDVYVAILRLVSWNFLKLILIFIIPIIAFSSG
ncbi:serine/threonine-protein phosphatase 6 regulatory ankyrin repeat subunit A-like [Hyalella azteca]|uniref:Serine/threonine-protein phosphatase 6 regulatory ankyrin repeat subunit A-like n=1 Tax=Hyalella azteca TaxID=294128 RepID=A0A979FKT3_HYAAZ|nr:serine/threonine-protein phosphatase 6 regulatory ankyrin repeat subunit A-like [Hyalella azteca]